MLNLIVFTLLALLPLQKAHAAETLTGDHVKISWLAPEQFDPAMWVAAIHFELEPGWHVYWKNPGDSGAAPKFEFSGEAISAFTQVFWPIPHRLAYGDLTNIGYEKAVAFPVILRSKNTETYGMTPAFLDIAVKLEWLVCKVECIPGFGTLTLKRPVREQIWNKAKEKLFYKFARQNQAPLDSAWNDPKVTQNADGVTIEIARKTDEIERKKDLKNNPKAEAKSSKQEANSPKQISSLPDIFPVDRNFIASTKPEVAATPTGYSFKFKLVPGASRLAKASFLVVDGEYSYEFRDLRVAGAQANGDHTDTDTSVAKAGTSAAEVATATTSGATSSPGQQPLPLLLFFAFIGGILLNLMPCVFPVITLKFFSLVKYESTLRERLAEALLYTAGVLATFLALGAALLALRASGSAVGWGFHLQSPLVVLSLILLFWLMALNFFGVFEFGNALMNKAGRSKYNSPFAMGMLSVFVAAPCTGPFMGSALGAAATLPAISALAIFAGLGLGLASPFIVFAMSPRLTALLPKPGAWMETFKQFLAFPLLATTIWLAWVLGSQIGDLGWLLTTSLLLYTAFAIWWGGHLKTRVTRTLLWLVSVAIVLWSFGIVFDVVSTPKSTVVTEARWQPYNKDKINAARAAGRQVFIDFTAAWCITCQVNKKTVLETEAAEKLFGDDIYLVRADWTNYNAEITEALAEFGRNSVPTYVYYAAGSSSAKILPQILTLAIIESTLNEH